VETGQVEEIRRWGKALVTQLKLNNTPVGFRFLRTLDEIPEGTLRPKIDRGQHLAQCQAFALARFQGLNVTMLKEDHWCWGPLVGYGLVNPQPAIDMPETSKHVKIMPRLPFGDYIGMVCAPLSNINFIPDLVLIYSNTGQLRRMLMALNFMNLELVDSQFVALDSCVYSVVPTITQQVIRITLPDPGENERAGAGDDEIILSVPLAKMETLMKGLDKMQAMLPVMAHLSQDVAMLPDFPRPEFYKKLFSIWGL